MDGMMDGNACLYGLFYLESHWLVNKPKHLFQILQESNFDFLITLEWKENDKIIIFLSKCS